MDPRYMVKKYIGVVRGNYGWFAVFTTKDPKVVLFCALAGTDENGHGGYQGGLQFPVERKRLKRGVLPPGR